MNKVACPACEYLVFANTETAFFEICPVCNWQNDGTAGNNYSSCNRTTLNRYKASLLLNKQRLQQAKNHTKDKS